VKGREKNTYSYLLKYTERNWEKFTIVVMGSGNGLSRQGRKSFTLSFHDLNNKTYYPLKINKILDK
jgi:hypothetical protein